MKTYCCYQKASLRSRESNYKVFLSEILDKAKE